MQQIIGHRLEFCLIVIYIGYQSTIDSLQWNVESTLELDSKGANTPMGPNGPHSKLKYLVGMGYEGQNDSRFTIVHKGIFGNFIKLH